MPKIIVREYDKTKAGVGAYQNFSVVVPGFCAVGKGTDCFDENDIYECDSQEEFVEKIGKVPCGNGQPLPAEAPECEYTPKTFVGEIADWEEMKKAGNLYEATEWKAESTPIDGYLKCAHESGAGETDGKVYFKGVFDLVEEDDEFDEDAKYTVILPNYVGKDAVSVQQFGNQIAYELLGLGYTVLYKKINSSVTELNSENFWKALKDKATYDFRYIMTGLINNAVEANEQIVNLVNFVNSDADTKSYIELGRGDAIALIDIDSAAYVGKTSLGAIDGIADKVNSLSLCSKYAAIFAPYVTYSMSDSQTRDFGGNSTFPASFHYLACAAKAFENYNE